MTAAPAIGDCDRSGCGYAACAAPATPTPSPLWGEIEPVDPSPLPSGRDSSSFNEFTGFYSQTNFFMSADTVNGYLIGGMASALNVYDIASSPSSPTLLGHLPLTSYPVQSNNAEMKLPLMDVAVPSGDDTLAAQSGLGGIGIAIFDLADKFRPKVLYQNAGRDGSEVYAATIGGAHYAFLAAGVGSPSGGLFAYNMDQARQYSRCSETTPGASCPGVYVGRIGTKTPIYVDGVDHYLVASSGAGRGFEIWDVANPAAPQLKLTGLTDRSLYGVALWKDGPKYYLAGRGDYDPSIAASDFKTYIYDVSCIKTSCTGTLTPLWKQAFPQQATPNFYLTFSRSGANPFLYLGSDNRCGGSLQREWLLDVSDPASPRDITPPAKSLTIGGVSQQVGYWGWYYRGNTTGFNAVMPRRGKFSGKYFYRAAESILDIHKRTTPDDTPPAAVAEGTAVRAESCVAANQGADPGEYVTVQLCIGNGGTLAFNDLDATLQAGSGVLHPSAGQSFGLLAGGALGCRDFRFEVDPNRACGATIAPTLSLSDSGVDIGTIGYSLRAGGGGACCTRPPTAFYSVSPCRALDTRGNGAPLQGPALTSLVPRLLPLPGLCGVPASAQAVAVNLTASAATAPGTIEIFPANYPALGTPWLHFLPGRTRANNAVLPLASDGSGLIAQSFLARGGHVDLLLDIVGYFQ